MAKLTSELILSIVDRVTARARGISKVVDTMRDRIERNNRQLSAMHGRMVEAAAVGYGLYRAIKAPVQAAIEFESAMADVRKVVDFPTPEAFKTMSSDIVAMSTRIPIAATGIAEIVAAAGQAGMAGEELLAFTEIAAKTGVAFDMTAGAVGEALAKIKTQLQLSVTDTGALADAINHLSNTSASAAPDIVEYMKRVAAVGEQYGFTATQTAAIGSSMIATGANAEVAATSFRNVGRALSRGASATKRQSEAFKRLGLDASDVSKRMQEDAVGTLRDVLVRIRELPEHLQASTISDIFGDEARAIAPLINNLEILDGALASVADRASYLGSSQREYEARAATTANAMQLFSNKVAAAGIAIGSALLPALNSVMDALGPIVMAVARFAEENPRLTQTIVALTAGLIGLRVAALAAQFGFLWMRGAVLSTALGGLLGLKRAVAVLTWSFVPFRAAAMAARRQLIGFAASAAIAGKGQAFKQLGKSVLGLLNPLRLVRASVVALKLALISSGIGAIVVGLGMAGAWIYQNWKGIKAMFAGIGEGIAAAFPGAAEMIERVKTVVGDLFESFRRLTGPIDATADQWRAFGREIGTTIGTIVTEVTALPGRITAALATLGARLFELGADAIQQLLEGMRAKIAELIEWVKQIPSMIREAIGNIDLSNMISWPSRPSWLGGGGDKPEARASGGPVTAGSLYRVGERGPELFVPPVDGHIVNARQTADMIAAMQRSMPKVSPATLPVPRAMTPARVANRNGMAANGNGPVSVTFGNIVIQGGAGASAEQLRREFGRQTSEMMRNHFSDNF